MRLDMISIVGVKNSFRQRNLTVIEIVFYILTIIVLFNQINEYIPTEPLIVLEVEALETSSAYSLTGSASDQDYLLEYIKIYPHSKVPIKQASFHYDYYKKDVNLKKIQIEEPTAYIISKELLQQAYGKEGFRFDFLENDRFKFNFEFDQKVEKLKFECQVVTVKQRVPCEVVEKGFLLSSWYAIVVHYSFYALIITVIVVFWFFRYNKRKEEIGGHFPNDEGILKPEK
jgi:hypothetical protein